MRIPKNLPTVAGTHLLLDVKICDGVKLETKKTTSLFETVCKKIGATVLSVADHEFDNGGFSGIILLAESHCSWHYWIEEDFLTIDLFTCGKIKTFDAIQYLKKNINFDIIDIAYIHRGKNYKNLP